MKLADHIIDNINMRSNQSILWTSICQIEQQLIIQSYITINILNQYHLNLK